LLLREERVAVVPGSAFGAGGEGYARACYASGYEQIERALERIGRFVQRRRWITEVPGRPNLHRHRLLSVPAACVKSVVDCEP
jgi:hypothetical protein